MQEEDAVAQLRAWSPYFLLRVALVLALVYGALGSPPYTYFTLLRWVTFSAGLFLAFKGYRNSRIGPAWAFLTIAALFNPFLPVGLQRSVWVLADLAAAVLFAVVRVGEDEAHPERGSK